MTLKIRITIISTVLCAIGFAGLAQQKVNKTVINPDIELTHIRDSIFIHTTWFEIKGDNSEKFPSNGLLIVRNGKALMVDTPNSNEQTQQMFDFLKDSLGITVTKVVVSHFHSDCLGGLEFLHEKKVESISGDLTYKKCEELKLPLPKTTFAEKMELNFEGETVICQYFGGGHTHDNIVVYVPKSRVMFGGCLIKSVSATDLGNIADASVNEWQETVMKMMLTYPEMEVVIPGHGDSGSSHLLYHTIQLVKAHTKNNK